MCTQGEGKKVLKKLIMVYIQKGLALVYPKKINKHIICLFRNNLFSSLLKIFGWKYVKVYLYFNKVRKITNLKYCA